jgi:hypothetical protein
MSDQYVEPITAATTAVTISKLGSMSGTAVAVGASWFQQYGIAVAGLAFTVLFGALGLLLSHYFKNKEFEFNRDLKIKEDARRDAEHVATMARLTARLTAR